MRHISWSKVLFVICLVIMVMAASGCDRSEPPTGRIAEVVVWHDLPPEATDYLKEALAPFREEEPGIVFSYKRVASDKLVNTCSKAMPNGTGPDIVISTAGQMAELASRRLISPIDFIYRRRKAEFIPVGRNLGKTGGKFYGVPVGLSAIALLYNKDFVPIPPKDTSELLKKVQELSSIGKLGLAAPFKNALYTYGFYTGYNQTPLKVDINQTALYYQLVLDLIASQQPNPPDISQNEDAALQALVSESAGMAILSQRAFYKLEDAGLDYGVAPLPKITGQDKPSSSIVFGHVAMVSSFSGDKQLAADVAMGLSMSRRLEPLLRFLSEMPAANRTYTQAPYNTQAAKGFRKALLSAGEPPGIKEASPLLSALSKGMNLALTKEMSPIGAASEANRIAHEIINPPSSQ